jgi:hypothetical protein
MTDELRTLHDTGLAYLAKQLEIKITALRSATSAIGIMLLQQYTEKLDQVRAEQERRRT